MNTIASLTAIFLCQLAGEFLAATLALPVPGPVCGMAILFLALLLRGSMAPALEATADTFLRHLSLLFVPAGVGIIGHLTLLREDGLALALALVVSTALAIAVTGLVMSRLQTRADPEPPEQST